MEKLTFTFKKQPSATVQKDEVLVGVVSSGNLEVLAERHSATQCCTVEVNTSATGFNSTWQAVLEDLISRFATGGVNFYINDSGATPAVVELRLIQALEALA